MGIRNWFNPFWINYLPWVKKYGEIIFAVLSIIIAVVCSIYCYVSVWYIIIPLLVFLLMFAMNKWSYMETFVNIGCCALIFALFQLISYSCDTEKDGIVWYLGWIPASFICAFLYGYSPWIVNKINSDLSDNKAHSFSIFFAVILYLLSGVSMAHKTNTRIKDAQFAKEVFVPVKQWSIEVHNGNTYYIVTCSRGTLAISPYAYPEIRQINDSTRIRFLKSNYPSEKGLTQYYRLDIKN